MFKPGTEPSGQFQPVYTSMLSIHTTTDVFGRACLIWAAAASQASSCQRNTGAPGDDFIPLEDPWLKLTGSRIWFAAPSPCHFSIVTKGKRLITSRSSSANLPLGPVKIELEWKETGSVFHECIGPLHVGHALIPRDGIWSGIKDGLPARTMRMLRTLHMFSVCSCERS